MNFYQFSSLVLIFIFCACSNAQNLNPQAAGADQGGDASELIVPDDNEYETFFQSPLDISESCVALAKIPSGDYSTKDREQEAQYCALNVYSEGFALCPKTWSTSPGTMIYDLSDSNFTTQSYESSDHCGEKRRGPGVSTFAKFKQTMNASGTSGTLSQSSLLYYHFSRYFDTKVTVPVAVYRELDSQTHLERVARLGLRRANGEMNRMGWKHLVRAHENPNSYSPTSDIFTEDRDKIYGVMLRGKGERYTTEFNGTRVSGWGAGQNRDFQKTPGFLALRESGDLRTAMRKGLERAAQDSRMRPDLVGINELQMAFWMRELIEITLLDYIFSQQDRVGNIDYRWYWYYVKEGEVKRKREKRDEYEKLSRQRIGDIPVPEDLASYNPVLVQRTNINDNDAGGRVAYANFAKSTDMLENLKHYSAKTYNLLMKLNRDLQNQGPVYQWLNNNIDLTERRVRQVVNNTKLAAEILKGQCSDLIFDLDDVDNFLVEGPRTETVDCNQ